MFNKLVFILINLLILTACSDSAQVLLFEKNVPKEKITCLNLVIFPPNEKIKSTFEKLYDFDENCSLKVEVSTKSGITCNSNQNYQSKALGSFPSSYLKVQVNASSKIVYSYYIDLKNEVTPQDMRRAFNRLRKDLELE